MIINYNGSGFIIDMEASIKAAYSTSAEIKINDVSVVTGALTILPYTWIPVAGVHKITVVLTNAIGTVYTENRCYLADKTLVCKVAEDLKKHPNNPSGQLYYLLNEGAKEYDCTCVCDNLKTIYSDLSNSLNTACCI
jgi:hypothetical protein